MQRDGIQLRVNIQLTFENVSLEIDIHTCTYTVEFKSRYSNVTRRYLGLMNATRRYTAKSEYRADF